MSQILFPVLKENIEYLDTLVYVDSNNRLQTFLYKKKLIVKTNCILNWHTRSYLRKVSRIVRHSELSAFVQPSRNTGNIPKT